MTTGPLAEATGLALLHVIWEGALIAGILAATLALMKRSSANSRYLVSCAALTLLLASGIATAYRSYTPAPVAPQPMMSVSWEPDSTAPSSLTVPAPSIATAIFSVRPYTPYIVLVWLAGVIVFTLRLVVSWRRTISLAGADASRDLQHLVQTLSTRLGITRAVRLVESAAVDVPSVVGWLRPVILLPISSLTGLTHQQLEMVLAHELAHIRRHDFLVNALQSVAETLLFYHPAAWWISRQIRIERENCCDDLAVATCGDALQYARALAQLEELRAVAAPAVAANGGSLFERVRRLVTARGVDRDARAWAAAAAVLGFTVIVALTAMPILAAKAEAEKVKQAKPAEARVEVNAPEAVEADPIEADPDIDLVDVIEVPGTPAPARPAAPARPPRPGRAVTPTPAVAPLAPTMRWTVLPTPAVAPTPMAMLLPGDFDGPDDFDDDDKPTSNPSGQLSVDELIALRVHNITPEFIDAMRAEFGPDTSIRSITSLKVMNVTGQYLAEMRAAGVTIKTAREATSLKAMNVTPAFVKSLSSAGYTNLSARDLTRLAASGIDADFIKSMERYKTKTKEKVKEK